MTHGHELKGAMLVEGWCRAEGDKGEKKWDNCNNIINIIYLKITFISTLHLIII